MSGGGLGYAGMWGEGKRLAQQVKEMLIKDNYD